MQTTIRVLKSSKCKYIDMHLHRYIEWFIYLISIFSSVEATQQFGKYYSIYKNTKCSRDILEYLNANTKIECAAQCTKRQRCSRVNFKRPQCQIVTSGDNGTIVEEEDWWCIRKYNYLYKCYVLMW